VLILNYAEAEAPADLRRQVLALQDAAWPPGGITRVDDGRLSHDPVLRPLTMMLVDDGTVLAALDILFKQITHVGVTFESGGLSTVVTRADMRGRGYGRDLVLAARDEMRRLGIDIGLFTCDTPLRSFYEQCGFEVLPGTVLIGGTPEAPFPSDQFDKVTLAAFFTDKAVQHRDTFTRARIELYSGEIDKLW
jgi:aminoglycoside 2'-N-acetyltransferase I